MTITDNDSAGVIALNPTGTAAGRITITDNGAAVLELGPLQTTGGLTLDSTGTGPFSLGDGTVAGNLDLDLSGYDSVTGATAGGATDISNETSEATMSVQLPTGAFVAPVAFSMNHIDTTTLVPEAGTTQGGTRITVNPVSAYQFTFGVPTLNQAASLSFEIKLAGLTTEKRDALIAAVANGSATLVTKGDAPGSTYQSFTVCPVGVDPTVDGCVRVESLDATGQPTTDVPVTIRFSNIVGHFSTWAVAITAVPTAASVSVSGRVTDWNGRGIRGAMVRARSIWGNRLMTSTNSFGYYRLSGLTAGDSYLLSVEARRYSFADGTRLIELFDSVVGENFIADPRFAYRSTIKESPTIKSDGVESSFSTSSSWLLLFRERFGPTPR